MGVDRENGMKLVLPNGIRFGQERRLLVGGVLPPASVVSPHVLARYSVSHNT